MVDQQATCCVGNSALTHHSDTIAAIATPPGKGGVGIVRISGPQAQVIGTQISGRQLPERQAVWSRFRDTQAQTIDTGLAIYFAAPRSFTGEEVVELHGHGGPVIQDMLLAEVLNRGARQARAGEFSERAFLNDKLDLAQVEAIADLINSSTQAAARGAQRTLQGEFSNKIQVLVRELIELRVYVEAAIDFPEEEIDFLADPQISTRIEVLKQGLQDTIAQAGQGAILKNGLTVVLSGAPNVGKSSLFNALAEQQTAIVTDVPGTTRDIIRQTISLDGLPLHLIDTAGLRDTQDQVEQIGVARAREAITQADHVLYLVDASSQPPITPLPADNHSLIINKIDLIDHPQALQDQHPKALLLSLKTRHGLTALKLHLKKLAGFEQTGENNFTARRRHINALERALDSVERGIRQLTINQAGELLADELRQAQQRLGEITGEFKADDLLGEIFAGFCIGK